MRSLRCWIPATETISEQTRPGAVAATLPPEGLNADAGHRREDEAAGDLDAAEGPVLAKIDLHRARW